MSIRYLAERARAGNPGHALDGFLAMCRGKSAELTGELSWSFTAPPGAWGQPAAFIFWSAAEKGNLIYSLRTYWILFWIKVLYIRNIRMKEIVIFIELWNNVLLCFAPEFSCFSLNIFLQSNHNLFKTRKIKLPWHFFSITFSINIFTKHGVFENSLIYF